MYLPEDWCVDVGSVLLLVTLGERWCDDNGVLGLLWLCLCAEGESCEVGLCPVLTCLVKPKVLLGSAGEFNAEEALGEGRDKLDVGLLGEVGLGLCKAIGTLADLGVWWYGGGGPCSLGPGPVTPLGIPGATLLPTGALGPIEVLDTLLPLTGPTGTTGPGPDFPFLSS